jgi:predicted nucleotidyltransferase
MNAINKAQEFSRQRIELLRQSLSDKITSEGYSVVLGGSYARQEASLESDLDFYIVAKPEFRKNAEDKLAIITNTLTETIKPPGVAGPFGSVHSSDEMQRNIGGDEDGNKKFTVRMLFLTEGEWLSNKDIFHETRKDLVQQYLRQPIRPQQLGRFFLNDVIRYYRTICVDFENKTGERKKEWGPRNIKLVFSRKLLYFSSIIVAAEIAGLQHDDKILKMIELLNMTPLKRIMHVFSSDADNALNMYNYYLERFSMSDVRKSISQVKPVDNSHETNGEFRSLKDVGHEFSSLLIKLVKAKYSEDHPIHEALLM